MKIAVNTRLLLKGKLEGIGWFTFETLKRITAKHPEHQFIFIFDRPYGSEFIFGSNVTPVVIGPQSRHPLLWYYWFEHSIPRVLKETKADIFVSPDGYLSLKTTIPQLSVIHDINFYHQPKGLPWLTSRYLNHYFPKFAKKAKRIVTVSQYSKTDISNHFFVDPKNIDVVYNGASEQFIPLAPEKIALVRADLTNGKPYFVFVGAFNPRKNLARLIEAYGIFRRSTSSDVKLVLVGEPMFKTSDIQRAYKKSSYKNDIIFIGRKGIDELTCIIGAALAMVYPSTFEGFGIPVLEAMKCGIPIAASKATAIPEVAGNAAIYFDPYSIEEMAKAMLSIFIDAELRNMLTNRAINREKEFSWDKTTELLYSSIEKCFV